MSDYTIQKIQKPIMTNFIKIKDKELRTGIVIEILEAIIDGPVKNYEIDEDTAKALVELGYLGTRYGSRQAVLYYAENKALCGDLYSFLFSDEPTLYVKHIEEKE